jgi:hypothetical protein
MRTKETLALFAPMTVFGFFALVFVAFRTKLFNNDWRGLEIFLLTGNVALSFIGNGGHLDAERLGSLTWQSRTN